MGHAPLTRHAGPIALTAGVLFTLTQLVALAAYDGDPLTMWADPVYRINSFAQVLSFAGLVIAAVATYGWEARRAGALGAVGLSAAIVGTMFLGGDAWFEAFAVPWLGDVLPEIAGVSGSGWLAVGGGASYLLFALGWALFGVASLRPRVFPPVVSLAIVVGGLLGYSALRPPFGVPLGLAIAWLGVWLMRTSAVVGEVYEPVPGAGAARGG